MFSFKELPFVEDSITSGSDSDSESDELCVAFITTIELSVSLESSTSHTWLEEFLDKTFLLAILLIDLYFESSSSLISMISGVLEGFWRDLDEEESAQCSMTTYSLNELHFPLDGLFWGDLLVPTLFLSRLTALKGALRLFVVDLGEGLEGINADSSYDFVFVGLEGYRGDSHPFLGSSVNSLISLASSKIVGMVEDSIGLSVGSLVERKISSLAAW